MHRYSRGARYVIFVYIILNRFSLPFRRIVNVSYFTFTYSYIQFRVNSTCQMYFSEKYQRYFMRKINSELKIFDYNMGNTLEQIFLRIIFLIRDNATQISKKSIIFMNELIAKFFLISYYASNGFFFQLQCSFRY